MPLNVVNRGMTGGDVPGEPIRWSPELDLRNIGISLVNQTLAKLPEAAWEPWTRGTIGQLPDAEAQLREAHARFADAFRAFVADPADSLGAHLKAAGFAALPWAAQSALFATLGRMALAFVGYAYKTLPCDEAQFQFNARRAELVAEAAHLVEETAPPRAHLDRVGLGMSILRRYGPGDVLAADDGLLVTGPGLGSPEGVSELEAATLEACGWRWDPDLAGWRT